MKHQDALDQLARETARASRRIALERGLRAGFWLLLAIGVWAAFALFGGHERLPLLTQSLLRKRLRLPLFLPMVAQTRSTQLRLFVKFVPTLVLRKLKISLMVLQRTFSRTLRRMKQMLPLRNSRLLVLPLRLSNSHN